MNGTTLYPSSSIVYGRPSTKALTLLALKRAFYRACKLLGLFVLARRLTRRSLRIITYHGFAIADEYLFSPRTFIRPETFEARMEFLARKKFPVLDLGEALDRLERGDLPPCAVVITIDDGFYGTYAVAFPVLARRAFPATVYVTTYYVRKENPVFGLAVQYLLWKTQKRALDAHGLDFLGASPVPITNEAEKGAALQRIIGHGETECDGNGRMRLAEMIGERTAVDFARVRETRIFSLVNETEIREMASRGIDIQMHTHRHVFPPDKARALGEIRDNRAALEPLVSRPLVHFCYPKGKWSEEQLPWLAGAGVRSAVTCDRGLNDRGTPLLALRRFGDDESLSRIEFEAELSGFAEMVRKCRGAVIRLAKRDVPR
jgi:peptidoglycan/xylan/chitin deacetylase (PgdA/CDA1 family)